MKIMLRPRLCSQPLSERIAADPALARALGAERNGHLGFLFKKFFDSAGPLLDAVLAQGQALGERMSFLRDLQFTAAELAAATHLEVVCRKTIGQTDAETRATLDEYHAAPLHETASRWRVRLPARVYLSKPVPPDTIAHVDQYTGEYVAGVQAAQALRASGFGGFDLQSVLHWKTKQPQEGVGFHLTTRELLAAALETPSVYETFDDGPRAPGTPRRHGALTYAKGALDASPDFARTAEPWCDWSTPQWVVRQRVRGWCVAAGVKGWAFWPVLLEGSPLQGEHEAAWAGLRRRLHDAGADLF